MGSEISCECIQESFKAITIGIAKQTQSRNIDFNLLHADTKFQKKAYLGLTTSDIFIRLNSNNSAISWRTPSTSAGNAWAAISGGSAEEYGEISLPYNVATIRAVGTHGFAIVDFSKQILLEVIAADPGIRDKWVVNLNELLQSWVENPDTKPVSVITAASTSDKVAYFAQREKEIEANKKLAEEKKKKYTAGGMKYTAIAMMNRGSENDSSL
jgi:hypothetical protein